VIGDLPFPSTFRKPVGAGHATLITDAVGAIMCSKVSPQVCGTAVRRVSGTAGMHVFNYM